jgi:hypothetical protein
LFVYDVPGSVAWVQRLANCSGLGRAAGAPGGAGAGGFGPGGGGSNGSGASTAASCTENAAGLFDVIPEATDVTPADAAPIAASAAAPVARSLTVMAVPFVSDANVGVIVPVASYQCVHRYWRVVCLNSCGCINPAMSCAGERPFGS